MHALSRVAAAALTLLVSAGPFAPHDAHAQSKAAPAAPAASPAKPAAPAASGTVEEQLRQKMQEVLGERPDSVTRTPYGIFEVVIGTDIFYTDQAGSFLFVGRLFDAKTRANLTQARRDELMRIDFAKLPLEQAIRVRNGRGTRQIVTFEDPNCSFCRKLHIDLQKMKDITVHVFLFPILSPDSFEKAKNIWCAKDRAAAWNALMIEGKAPPAAPDDCKHPLQQNLALGQKIGVEGTPTIVFTDGNRAAAALPVEEIEKRLATAGAARR